MHMSVYECTCTTDVHVLLSCINSENTKRWLLRLWYPRVVFDTARRPVPLVEALVDAPVRAIALAARRVLRALGALASGDGRRKTLGKMGSRWG